MKFDISGDLNPGAWFDLVDGKPEEGRICLRVLPAGERSAIYKKHVKKQVEYKKGQRFEFFSSDDEGYDLAMWDYCIVDWDGIEDADGKPIECNAANKVALVDGSVELRAIINTCFDKLNKDFEKSAKAAEKN